MNQVLARSLNTSFVAIIPILSIEVIGAWILGASTLNDFGLALLIGLTTGAYSSIFIASPLLGLLKEREPRYADIRRRMAQSPARRLTPAAAAASRAVADTGGGAGVPARPARPASPTRSSSRPRPAPRRSAATGTADAPGGSNDARTPANGASAPSNGATHSPTNGAAAPTNGAGATRTPASGKTPPGTASAGRDPVDPSTPAAPTASAGPSGVAGGAAGAGGGAAGTPVPPRSGNRPPPRPRKKRRR
jgi:hypothetical protein